MIEHEFVHVYAGPHDGPVRPDPQKADGFAWVTPAALLVDLRASSDRYSVWFRKYCAEHWDRLTDDARWQELAAAALARTIAVTFPVVGR